FVDEKMILNELGNRTRTGRIEYRRFVEEGLIREIENPFEAVQWQAALGRETFLRKVRDRMKGLQTNRREITSLRTATEFTSPQSILNNVAKKFQVSARSLTEQRGYGMEPRNLAMWIISERCGMTLRQIGELFGGIDYAAVAQRIKRARNKYSEKEARALIVEMSNV
ncbi:MAG TPA: helix-turn-helix domain-containing protein, partial [Chthoniobacterales bacterium]